MEKIDFWGFEIINKIQEELRETEEQMYLIIEKQTQRGKHSE